MTKTLSLKNIKIANNLPFVIIAGPCQMESRDHALMMAENLTKITSKLNIPFIYKSSFDKANRTSVSSKRGIGIENSISIFAEVREKFGCPVITDIHNEEQCKIMKDSGVVDIIQIPAFLCRQTDLLKAAAETKLFVNIKKGQFLAPNDMQNVVEKMEYYGNTNILLTERGVTFGYNNLVSDMRSLPIMAETGYPVIFDATHSVQQPGGMGKSSGGKREFAEVLARAAVAVGVAGVFAEVHQDPDNAPSDGPNMIKLSEFERILTKLKRLDEVAKSN